MIDIGVSEDRARSERAGYHQNQNKPTVTIGGTFRLEHSDAETAVTVEMPIGAYLRRLR